MLRDLGEGVRVASSGIHLGNVESHGGDLSIAEQQLRLDFEALDRMGERYHLPIIAGLLAKIIRDRGRDEEALPLLAMAEELTSANDTGSQAFWRSVRAPILARSGQLLKAEELAQSAVEMLRKTESPGLQADALGELTTVLVLAGKRDAALESIDEAISLYEAKGNLVSRNRLASLRTTM
jgi:tetratricopeptide (TPR) repeat protein